MINWISQLINSQPGQTSTRKLSTTGCLVIERYGCGQLKNNKLIFSAKDKSQLRQHIIKEFDKDLFATKQLPNNRLDAAKHHHNEKLANHPVSQDHILINSPAGVLQLNHQQIQLHSEFIPSAGLMALSSKITQVNHDVIIVIENLAIMQLCQQLKLPSLCQNSLWIYRGDHKTGAKINASHAFVKKFGQHKKIIVFSDMDPKGLEIALTFPYAIHWLGPDTAQWTSCLESRYASKSGYDNQTKAMKYLLDMTKEGSLSQVIETLISLLKDKQSSYRQEHMYAHNIPLSLFPLKKL